MSGRELSERRDLRQRLDDLRGEADPRRRRLVVLGLLTRRLASRGVEPILVGGAALEFYTAGGYATGDIDLALPSGKDVDAAFADIQEGRALLVARRSGSALRSAGARRAAR